MRQYQKTKWTLNKILTFILEKSITWNIEGAIKSLGSKASTTGFMEQKK